MREVAQQPFTAPGAEEAGGERPLRILFVCTANTCRSPYMELAARRLLGSTLNVTVASAGTHGVSDHAMSEEMMAGYESEAADFRSRRVGADLVADADLILTAEAAHATLLVLEHPEVSGKVFTLGQFAHAATALDRTVTGRGLIETVGRRRPVAAPHHDVADPYRTGPGTASACAARIDELLAIVIPALQPTQESQ